MKRTLTLLAVTAMAVLLLAPAAMAYDGNFAAPSVGTGFDDPSLSLYDNPDIPGAVPSEPASPDATASPGATASPAASPTASPAATASPSASPSASPGAA